MVNQKLPPYDDNTAAIKRDRALISNYVIDLAKSTYHGFSVVQARTYTSPASVISGRGLTTFPLSGSEAREIVRIYPSGIIFPEEYKCHHKAWEPWLQKQVNEKMTIQLGGGSQKVNLEFQKMIICGNGTHWSDERYTRDIYGDGILAVIMPSKHQGGKLGLRLEDRYHEYECEGSLTAVHLVSWLPHVVLEREPITTGCVSVLLYAVKNLGFMPILKEDGIPPAVTRGLYALHGRNKLIVIPFSPGVDMEDNPTQVDENITGVLWNLTNGGRRFSVHSTVMRIREKGWTTLDGSDPGLGQVEWGCSATRLRSGRGDVNDVDKKEDEVWSALRLGVPMVPYLNHTHPKNVLYDNRGEARAQWELVRQENLGTLDSDDDDNEAGYEWQRDFGFPCAVLIPCKRYEPTTAAKTEGEGESDKEPASRSTRKRRRAMRTKRKAASDIEDSYIGPAANSSKRKNTDSSHKGTYYKAPTKENNIPGKRRNTRTRQTARKKTARSPRAYPSTTCESDNGGEEDFDVSLKATGKRPRFAPTANSAADSSADDTTVEDEQFLTAGRRSKGQKKKRYVDSDDE